MCGERWGPCACRRAAAGTPSAATGASPAPAAAATPSLLPVRKKPLACTEAKRSGVEERLAGPAEPWPGVRVPPAEGGPPAGGASVRTAYATSLPVVRSLAITKLQDAGCGVEAVSRRTGAPRQLSAAACTVCHNICGVPCCRGTPDPKSGTACSGLSTGSVPSSLQRT